MKDNMFIVSRSVVWIGWQGKLLHTKATYLIFHPSRTFLTMKILNVKQHTVKF